MTTERGVSEVGLEIDRRGIARFSSDELPVKHGFSTMWLGNMSEKHGEEKTAKANRGRFLFYLAFLPTKTVRMIPRHTDKIEFVDPGDAGQSIECDALITSWPSLGLALLPADCFPVIIRGNNNLHQSFVALVHAGRGGTRLSIVAKTIRKMMLNCAVRKSSIKVYIGPGIGPCCYNGTDLVSEIVTQVMGEGVEARNIVVSNCCTYCSTDSNGEFLFFSHARHTREENQPGGRFMAFVSLR
ncbi:MAG: polyphenol oxidase family protein [Patescibacteria group bacterium]|nr:polyphenol oxidase family protein [Patescibacteria group bacterium]